MADNAWLHAWYAAARRVSRPVLIDFLLWSSKTIILPGLLELYCGQCGVLVSSEGSVSLCPQNSTEHLPLKLFGVKSYAKEIQAFIMAIATLTSPAV